MLSLCQALSAYGNYNMESLWCSCSECLREQVLGVLNV